MYKKWHIKYDTTLLTLNEILQIPEKIQHENEGKEQSFVIQFYEKMFKFKYCEFPVS